jgi:hypothetical protein
VPALWCRHLAGSQNESPCVATYVQNEGGTPFERSNATRVRTFEQKPLVRETSAPHARKIGRISAGARLHLYEAMRGNGTVRGAYPVPRH